MRRACFGILAPGALAANGGCVGDEMAGAGLRSAGRALVARFPAGFPPGVPALGAALAGQVGGGQEAGVMRVFTDQGAELRQPVLERVVKALLTGEPLVKALDALNLSCRGRSRRASMPRSHALRPSSNG